MIAEAPASISNPKSLFRLAGVRKLSWTRVSSGSSVMSLGETMSMPRPVGGGKQGTGRSASGELLVASNQIKATEQLQNSSMNLYAKFMRLLRSVIEEA